MAMRSNDIPLVYMTDCILATADGLAMLSRPPKGEIVRHGRIIQRALNTMESLGIALSSRPKSAVEAGGFSPWISRYGESKIPDILDAGCANDEKTMVTELEAFVAETLENPSSRLNSAHERSRHESILSDIQGYLAALDRIEKRAESEDSLGM